MKPSIVTPKEKNISEKPPTKSHQSAPGTGNDNTDQHDSSVKTPDKISGTDSNDDSFLPDPAPSVQSEKNPQQSGDNAFDINVDFVTQQQQQSPSPSTQEQHSCIPLSIRALTKLYISQHKPHQIAVRVSLTIKTQSI